VESKERIEMITHAIVGLILMLASAYAGYRYGARGVAAVKAEIAKIEVEAVTDAKAVIARVKSLL
jgi:hypothetical protein